MIELFANTLRRTSNYLVLKKDLILACTVILIAAILPFRFSGITGIISPMDANFPIHPGSLYIQYFYVWPNWGLGSDGTLSSPPQILYYISLAILNGVINNLAILNRVWYVFVYSLAGFSMLFLFRTLVKGRGQTIGGLVAGLFYMYNPTTVQNLVHGIFGYTLVMFTVPLTLGFFVRGFDSVGKANQFKSAFVFSCVYTLCQIPIDIQWRAVLLFPYFAFFVFRLLWFRSKFLKRDIVFGFFTITLTAALNMFWILPMIPNVSSNYQYLSAFVASSYNLAQISGANIFSLLRMYQTPGWSFDSYYLQSYVIFVSLLLVLISFAALLSRRLLYVTSFMVGMVMVLTLLSEGAAPPIGKFYLFMQTVPFGKVFFADNPGKWALQLVLPMSFLLGLTVCLVFSKLWNGYDHKHAKKILFSALMVVICSLIILDSLPLVNPPMIWNSSKYNYFKYLDTATIPTYYSNAGAWLNSQNGSFRVFEVPPIRVNGWVSPVWAPYSIADIVPYISNKPVVQTFAGAQFESIGQLQMTSDSVEGLVSNQSSVGQLLGMMSVKYVLCRNDLYFQSCSSYYFPGMPKVAQFGNITFYQNPYFAPVVHAASAGIAVFGSQDILSLSKVPGVQLNRSAVFFLNYSLSTGSENWLPYASTLLVYSDASHISGSTINDWKNATGANGILGYVFEASVSPVTSVNISWPGKYEMIVNGLSTTQSFPAKEMEYSNETNAITQSFEINNTAGTTLFQPVLLNAGEYAINMTGSFESAVLVRVNGNNPVQPNKIFYLNSEAQLSFVDQNPTDYHIMVNATTPAIIIFTGGYSADWAATNDANSVAFPHFLVNEYANAFVVNGGNYSITMRYLPQNLFQDGAAISIGALILSTAMIVMVNFKERRKLGNQSGATLGRY